MEHLVEIAQNLAREVAHHKDGNQLSPRLHELCHHWAEEMAKASPEDKKKAADAFLAACAFNNINLDGIKLN